MAVGRISGQLLKANLLREGVDLAFETDLLYLDVNNARIGINNSSPTTDLDVTGTIKATTLTVDDSVTLGNITLSGNTISSTSNTIGFAPSGGDPVVFGSVVDVDDIRLQGNTISTTVSNANLEISPNGTGSIELVGNTNITGDLDVTGNVTATGDIVIKGNIIIGDEATDEITFNAGVQSDILPDDDSLYDLGSPSLRWNEVHAANVFVDFLNVPTADIGDLSFRDNEIISASGTNIVLSGNGTGGVQFGNFLITDNVITNVANNQITQIVQSGDGYFKIDNDNGFVPPRGTTAERPTAYAVVGMTRYNTDTGALEVWNGSSFASPAGALGAVSEIQANDIAASFALMLG